MVNKKLSKDKDTEEKIFEAAREVFAGKGMDGARMQEIADRAGISKSLLHYYYRSKEKLFSAVFDDVAELIFRKFAQIFERDLPFEKKVEHFFTEHIDFLKANPGLPLFILSEINRNPERMKKLTARIDYQKMWYTVWGDLNRDPKQTGGRILHLEPQEIPQLVTTAISITVFPFAARNLLEPVLERSGYSFERYIEERKKFATRLVIDYLSSQKDA
ncbi:MAG: TetR/AcrR family transcriptional regulator [Bacteroidetes bacterium]|nr:TetR/AcrR family transcriptional regulator [Bacteroidota bacterium]